MSWIREKCYQKFTSYQNVLSRENSSVVCTPTVILFKEPVTENDISTDQNCVTIITMLKFEKKWHTRDMKLWE